MTIRFIYEPDYPRLIFFVMMEARAGTPLANKPGAIQKQFIDNAINAVTPETIMYRLENAATGVIAGVMTLITENRGQTAAVGTVTLRPAYQSSAEDISQQITIFVNGNGWQSDILI